MKITIRELFASLVTASTLVACGGAGTAEPAVASHAVPDFQKAERVQTPRSAAEEERFTASDGKTRLHPEDVVFFEFDSDRLTPSAVVYLTTAARWLIAHPSRQVVVEGYTDPTGTASYNIDLAHRRAECVRSFLVARGVAGARIETISLGETRAVYAKDDMNRRTVVYARD